MSTGNDHRSYRLEPLDTSGVLLGLGAVPCALIGAALTLAVVALSVGLPLIVTLLPIVMALALSFGRVGDHAAWEWLPLSASWLAGRARGRRWEAPLPLWSTDAEKPAPLPPCLAGIDVIDVPWRGDRATIGCVRDRDRHNLTALVPVASSGFALEPGDEQDRLLAGWGDVLNQFTRGRTPVAHLFWSDLSRPSTLANHSAWLAGARRARTNAAAIESYNDLLDLTADSATSHDVVVGITVARELVGRRHSGQTGSAASRLAEALTGATESLVRALESAGQAPGDPLDVDEVRRVMRLRVDPVTRPRRGRTGRLADRLGYVAPPAVGPLVLDTGWRHVRVDAAWHRTYWVAGWPQLALPPSWMAPFLAIEGVTRSMTVVLFPVTGRDSRRRIARDLVKLESDAATREERGRRVDARHGRVTEALLEREQELVAGFTEYEYVGLVTVSAASEDELDDDGELVEQLAREAGMDLRVLDGRQDIAWAAALPLGLAPKGLVTA